MDAFLLSFGVIFIAELGDKSQLMALAFATRYPALSVLVGDHDRDGDRPPGLGGAWRHSCGPDPGQRDHDRRGAGIPRLRRVDLRGDTLGAKDEGGRAADHGAR